VTALTLGVYVESIATALGVRIKNITKEEMNNKK